MIDERRLRILAAIVEQYTRTGEPVGSKFVAETMGGTISSATVRNHMVALEELGLLEQPHASAGRVPTHMGYRVYIDHLMRAKPLSPEEKREIDALFNLRNPDPDQLVREAAETLAEMTRMAAISSAAVRQDSIIRRIDIIPVAQRTAVIIVVTSTGAIKNKVVRLDFDLTDALAEFLTRFVNTRLVGRTVSYISQSYINSLAVVLGEYGRLFSPLLSAILELVQEIGAGEFYTGGTAYLLGYNELKGMAYDLLSFIENRSELIRLLSGTTGATSVIIGPESGTSELTDSSIMLTRYPIGRAGSGMLGLIGPVRMDYAKLLPHLEYFAQTLGRLLSEAFDE
jgi:heat-inducible transcriptional repressor